MKLGMRFLRHRGIFRSDVVIQILKSWGRGAAPRWSDPGPAKGRDGRTAPCSSSTMSSGRLFLDRVARQHGPSPLHRQAHPKTVSGWGTMNLQRTANSVLTVCLSQGDNRTLSRKKEQWNLNRTTRPRLVKASPCYGTARNVIQRTAACGRCPSRTERHGCLRAPTVKRPLNACRR